MPNNMHNPGSLTAKRPVVALLVETSNRYSRELLRGIRDYSLEHGQWVLHLTEQGRGDLPPTWLKSWRGHGILARIENRSIEAAVRRTRTPVVNLSASGIGTDFPTVISDSSLVAQLAADHLVERGLRHFAYCGEARFTWSKRHGENFAAHLRRLGYKCHVFSSRAKEYENIEQEQSALGEWLISLPKPAGIMACYDIRGHQVLEVCRQCQIQVPDELAVIGQHNDELLCELCHPPLSSVIPDPRRAGYEAARLLDCMMQGKPIKVGVHNIPPVGVATRQSTDLIAIPDHQVAAAVRFIRENACQRITVDDVLRAVPMSRTLLERKFRKYMGIAPYEEILRIKLRRANELLLSTDLPICEVAERTGFATAEYFSASFKQRFGFSPKGLRQSKCFDVP